MIHLDQEVVHQNVRGNFSFCLWRSESCNAIYMHKNTLLHTAFKQLHLDKRTIEYEISRSVLVL